MNGEQNFILDAIRTVFAALDWVMYMLLGWAYEIFFDVSTVEFFSSSTIKNFYGRIQLILGVLMVFKLSMSLIQSLIDPDKFNDKNSGIASVIKRAATCLIMLVMLMPLNIPNATNEYERQLNNNGMLFGTLYSLQYRILSNNTIGKLILGDGKSDSSTIIEVAEGENAGTKQSQSLRDYGKEFTATILKGFVRLDKKDSSEKKFNDCVDNFRGTYDSLDATGLLMDNLNKTCDGKYALYYFPIIGGAVALVFAIIVGSFAVDIAVRAIKIAILRLIAPVPIISYLDPDANKKGAFANWVKMLVSTYLDLFLRLAIVYFVVFLIQDIGKNGIVMGMEPTDTLTSILVFIVICLGLFFFAKQAPKFIKDALGLQGAMQNIGLASILGGTAMALGGGGLAGFAYGAMNGANAQVEAAAQGKPVPLMGAWSSNRDLMAKIRTGDKDAQGGAWGRLQDTLNYRTRERTMAELGMSKEQLAQASYAKDVADERAAAAQRELAFAQQRLQAKGTSATKDDYDAYYAAYTANEDAQAAAAKAGKTVDTMEKYRAQSGVAPDIRSTRKETSRSAKKVVTAKRYYQYDQNNNLIPVNDAKIEDKNTIASYEQLVNNGTYVVGDRAIDSSGKFIDVHNSDESKNIVYKSDTKDFKGMVDDSPFSGSGGTGAPGTGPGNGPRGGPGGPPRP